MHGPEERKHILESMKRTELHDGLRRELENLAKIGRLSDMIHLLNATEKLGPLEHGVVQDMQRELPSIVRRARFSCNPDFDMEGFREESTSPPPRTLIPGKPEPEPEPNYPLTGRSWGERINKVSQDPEGFDRVVRAIERPYLKSLRK